MARLRRINKRIKELLGKPILMRSGAQIPKVSKEVIMDRRRNAQKEEGVFQHPRPRAKQTARTKTKLEG